ncbi:TlyA family RNA methyltransferase [Gloeocapsa sp. PCC 73106]|uniref:TlyA family RNA methyltransferase n=1 Tax=Gloeocapsa sp. PCC 73106 TaxID=102232 RepID=UPI0002ABA408|nr:TlyA family RNA methyltransferase [Gloeocapsa sp. PCC 73106]ELR96567.1 hemolysin A [Gloeocapsa sp. PCC 73106]
MSKQRLDNLLVERNLCPSRQQAIRVIRAGWVKVNQQVIDKPGTEIPVTAEITLFSKPPYVSRGGEKLAAALTEFTIPVTGRICLDGGISTGGFTDCLLQAGAKRVYGVDVGYGQVAWELRQDSRLILTERTNFRYLTPDALYGEATPPDLGVMDLSFISLTKVLPTLRELLIPPREVVLLVKPQFEVGKDQVGKKGVVRDRLAQAQAIAQVLKSALTLGWRYAGLIRSPLVGPAGNLEYLLWLNLESQTPHPDLTEIHHLTQLTD